MPPSITSKPSSCSSPALHASPAPKRSTGVQAPRASTRSSAEDCPLETTSPCAGTMRTRWWNCVSMAARSGKMSAWSYSRFPSTAVRGRYHTNLERLSKNAVSYSSASITKKCPALSRAEMPKLRGMPPIRNPGSRPLSSRIHASIDEVVLLPWVPATASTHFSTSTFSESHCGSRGIGEPAVEDRLHHGLAARHRVAHHVEVGGVALELLGVVALVQLDAQRRAAARSWAGTPARRSRSRDGRARGRSWRARP